MRQYSQVKNATNKFVLQALICNLVGCIIRQLKTKAVESTKMSSSQRNVCLVAVSLHPRAKGYNTYLIDVTKPRLQNKQPTKSKHQSNFFEKRTQLMQDNSKSTSKSNSQTTQQLELEMPNCLVPEYECFQQENGRLRRMIFHSQRTEHRTQQS